MKQPSAILKAKGIPVLAHPGRYKLNEWEFDSMFKEFTEAGGHAIEVTTGSHTPGQNLLFLRFRSVEKSLGLYRQ